MESKPPESARIAIGFAIGVSWFVFTFLFAGSESSPGDAAGLPIVVGSAALALIGVVLLLAFAETGPNVAGFVIGIAFMSIVFGGVCMDMARNGLLA